MGHPRRLKNFEECPHFPQSIREIVMLVYVATTAEMPSDKQAAHAQQFLADLRSQTFSRQLKEMHDLRSGPSLRCE